MRPLVFSVLPRPPHPTRDGMAIRNYHLLAGLAEAFRVRAFSLRDPERSYEGEWPAGVEAETVRQLPRRFRRFAAAISSLLAGGAYSERLYRSFALSRHVLACLAEERPVWIVAHSYHVGLGALRIGGPVWTDFHNLDSEIWQRTADTAGSAAVRWFARMQQARVFGVEGTVASLSAGLSCVSERDARGLRAYGGRAAPRVIPNGVDLVRHAFRRDEPPDETVLFVGDLSWHPNAAGVRWLLANVWPVVRSRRPGARLVIVGRSAPTGLLGRGDPTVLFAGEGGDARSHWLEAAVAVVPLLAGGGTRLKILEAAATGVPVVSTSVGAEGLELADGSEILRRDDPATFAEAVVGLLADRSAARRQAAAARARVEELYDWARIRGILPAALDKAAGSRA